MQRAHGTNIVLNLVEHLVAQNIYLVYVGFGTEAAKDCEMDNLFSIRRT